MTNILYEEDCDRAYHAEIAEEVAERRTELIRRIEDCSTLIEDMKKHRLTPSLLELTEVRLADYRAELARMD